MSSRLTIDWQIHREHCRQCNELLFIEKHSCCCNEIAECGSDQKQLCNLTGNLIDDQRNLPLVEHKFSDYLANHLNDFFMNTISEICEKFFPKVVVVGIMEADIKLKGRTLAHIKPTSIDMIGEIITQAPNKSCDIDPLSALLLKNNVEFLLPIITMIINQSINQSIVPAQIKRSIKNSY